MKKLAGFQQGRVMGWRPRGLIGLTLVLCLLMAAACTVVKDDEESPQASKDGKNGLEIYFANDQFDPDAYVEGIWAKQVVPTVREQAVDLLVILEALAANPEHAGQQYGHREKGEGNPWNFIVKGEGQIAEVNTESRAGTISVDIAPYNGTSDLLIQIGPIIRGDSVRDALDFITFDMFTNQLEFGRLAKAFNAKVYNTVIGDLDVNTLNGKHVQFYGTFTLQTDPREIRLTPIQFELIEEN